MTKEGSGAGLPNNLRSQILGDVLWSGGWELESWVGPGPRSSGVSPAHPHWFRSLIPCSPSHKCLPARKKDLESQFQSVRVPTSHLFLTGMPCIAMGFPP